MTGPPLSAGSSLDSLAGAAKRRRRSLLAVYLTALPALTGVICVVHTGDDVDLISKMLGIVAVFLLLQSLMLYGGGPVGVPPPWVAALLASMRSKSPLRWLLRRRWLLGLLRWCVPVASFSLQMTTISAVIGVSFLDVTARGTLRRVSDWGPGEASSLLSGLGDALGFVPAGLTVGLLLALACTYGASRVQAMWRLVAVCWVSSLYAGLLNVLLQVMSLGEGGKFAAVVALSAFIASTGAALRLLFVRAPAPQNAPMPSTLPALSAFRGGASVSSARTLATVLLLVSYVAVDVAVDQARKMRLLERARDAFATHYLADIADAGESEAPPKLPYFLGQPRVREQQVAGLMGTRHILRGVEVRQTDGRRWTAAWATVGYDDPQEVAKSRLLKVASTGDIEARREEPFYELFGRVQRDLLRSQRQVLLPVVGVSVAATKAAWALALLTLMLLLLTRSRVRRVFRDPKLAMEEPWLVLDGHVGLERVAALTWLLLLLLVPWVSSAGLTVMLAVQSSAEGGVSSLEADVVRVTLVIVLLALSVWTAACAVAEIARLRALRLGAEAG